MTLAEALMIVVAWCGPATYGRLEPSQVDNCRASLMDCVEANRAADKKGNTVNNNGLMICLKNKRLDKS